jgi:hypothetical protein
MSSPHRATREEREMLELRTRLDCLERRCEVQLQQLSDLQDRHHRLAGSVRLLEREVATDRPEPEPSPVVTDQDLYQLYDSIGPTVVDAFRALYDLGRQHGAQRAAPPPEPPSAPPWWGDGQPAASVGSLVGEVHTIFGLHPVGAVKAGQTLRATAAWLRRRGHASAASALEQEASR